MPPEAGAAGGQAAHFRALESLYRNAAITRLTFRMMLLKRAYTKPEFEKLCAQTGFSSFDVRESGIGLEVEMDKSDRAAIS